MFHDVSMMPSLRRGETAIANGTSEPGRDKDRTAARRSAVRPVSCWHDVGGQRPLSITVKPDALVIVRSVGMEGCGEVGPVELSIANGWLTVLARPGQATFTAATAGRLQVVTVGRNRLQAAASASYGGARRLASLDPRCLASPALTAALAALPPGALSMEAEAVIVTTVAAALVATADLATIFPVVRSVAAAMHLVTREPERPWTTFDLASAAAVTAPVLRRGFRASLGVTVGQYILRARLDWLRERLSGGRETRTIAALAGVMNFNSPSAFARAYTRRFGETPSRTRAKAVAGKQ